MVIFPSTNTNQEKREGWGSGNWSPYRVYGNDSAITREANELHSDRLSCSTGIEKVSHTDATTTTWWVEHSVKFYNIMLQAQTVRQTSKPQTDQTCKWKWPRLSFRVKRAKWGKGRFGHEEEKEKKAEGMVSYPVDQLVRLSMNVFIGQRALE